MLWAAVLIPPLLRARSDRKAGSLGDYSNTMGAMKPSVRTLRAMSRPTASLVDGSMHRGISNTQKTKKRRKDVLMALLSACAVTFVLAIFLSSPLVWLLHIICDIALGAYIYLLIQFKEQEQAKRNSRSLSRYE